MTCCGGCWRQSQSRIRTARRDGRADVRRRSAFAQIRDASLDYALRTAEIGEDAACIMARAELYSEFLSSHATNGRQHVVVRNAGIFTQLREFAGYALKRDSLSLL